MELKEGYKQTEIGVIPEDWEVVLIENIAEIKTGDKNTQDKNPSGRYPFFVRSQSVERIDSYSFDCEAVLTAGDGVGTGKVFHYINGKFDVHQRVYIINNFSEKILGYFFFLYFSTHFYNRIMQMTAKSSVDSVRRDMIAEMPIALPPQVSEQLAISTALSDVDALLSSLDALIAKKRDIKTAAMQELVRGRRRLPGFKGSWKTKKIGEILEVCHGKGQSEVESSTGTIPILASGGQIGTATKSLYNEPSVLIGRKGTIDKPQYVDIPFWTIDTLFYTRIYPPNLPLFIFYVFCLVDWKRYNEASGVPSLNASTIENIEISLPPQEEQAAIAAVLFDMDAEIAALEARRAKVQALKQGMMQELLTGRTRLLPEGE